ncbi:glycosyltransferase family 2 protein [Clostridium botulinum]|uniref:glycosyltransferase family 2 protein n=1 Tax=Clostridium botulinum TaxID=1491 RepID=UPI001E2CA3B8|nr:glycosyltransferase [Clostridium botulinum]MCC5437584.1 glycosyltransferase [Clostridium botulinum]NFR57172.1 glycosyltransferase [Clostridium botulinum]
MVPPLISYVTFNRLGLTVKNLSSILDSTDDFELHIIDNNSTDGTWKYIQSLNDRRIKSRIQIGVNSGPIYALNLNLSKRKPDQYFITVDNDVYIETKDWITRFMKVFETFPEVGLLGVQRGQPYPEELPPIVFKIQNGVYYLELDNTYTDTMRNYIPGCCMCLRPELIKQIGYWCEENCFGDIELSNRINNYTDFKTGFVTNINIKMPQIIDCAACQYKDQCTLDKYCETCFTEYQNLYKICDFKKKFKWKFDETIKDMKSGARPVYCASILDANSTWNHIFNKEWALENFKFFNDNAN